MLGERDAVAQLVAAGPANLGVEIRRDRLQILDEHRFEARRRVELPLRDLEERAGRLLHLAMSGGIAVHVLDECGVELLLRLQRRTDQTPDESAKPPFERPVEPEVKAM